MSDLLLDTTAAALEKVLDGTSARQRALADNIANVDTPGYTRKEVTFEGHLREVLSRDGENPDIQRAEVTQVAPQEAEDAAAPRRGDGNNVNIETEMVTLAKNSLQHETAAHLLNLKLRVVKNAIHEGRR